MSGSNIRTLNSNFPGGFANGVTIRGMPVVNSYPGQVFWLDSTAGSDGNAGTFDRPFATLNYAVSKCTANRGDTIMVKAAHAETLTAAGAVAMNIAGVRVVGLGTGDQRPTFTFGTSAGASILITAANMSMENIIGLSGVDQLTNPFNVQAAGTYLDIEWRDTASNKEALRAILTSAAADRCRFKLRYIGQTGGSHCVNAIRLVGGDNIRIDVDFYGKASTAVVEFLTTACTDVEVSGTFYNSGTTDLSKNVVDTVTGSTWFVSGYDAAAGGHFDGGSGRAIAGDDSATIISGIAVPTADSTANTYERDVIGNKTDAAVYSPGTNKSLMAYEKGRADLSEKVVVTTAAVLSNGTNNIWTIAGGPIEIQELFAICATANDATATTLKFNINATSGGSTDVSAASASLANATAGTSLLCTGTFASATTVTAGGTVAAGTTKFIAPAGTIRYITATGPSTGTWVFYCRYRPLATGVTVS